MRDAEDRGLHLDLNNLLGHEADLDKGASGELDVKTGVHVHCGGGADDEIQGERRADVDLEETGDGDLQLRGGDELDGFVDRGAGG